jgi:thiamine-phosphate pyrophosphorylase
LSTRLPDPPLLVITDRRGAAGNVEDIVAAAFRGGCRWVMLREKDLSTEALAGLAGRLLAAAAPYEATVSVNGDWRAAELAGAQGVHLQAGGPVKRARHRLGEGALIGVSAHSRAEIEEAEDAGADYVTLSPIFPTSSKPGYGPAFGEAGLREAASRASIPIIALAGVTDANAGQCLAAGAAGVAAMGSVMRAADPAAAVAALIAAMGRAKAVSPKVS